MCSRILITITFLVLLLMPITGYLWTFDKFLRGGWNLELGCFALVTVFCLVSVLARHRREGVAILLAVPRLFTHYQDRQPRQIFRHTHAALSTPVPDSFRPSLFSPSASHPLKV